MGRLAGQVKPLNLIIVALLISIAVGGFIWRGRQMKSPQPDQGRPEGRYQFIYDYARVFKTPPQDLNRFLQKIRAKHAIETVVVTYNQSPNDTPLPVLARDLIKHWQIGESLNGAGILLLVAVKDGKLHIGVNDGLTETFTEQFRVHIQNWQWHTLMSVDRIEPALNAVAEEIDRRAGLIRERDFSKADILKYDQDLPAGPAISRDTKN